MNRFLPVSAQLLVKRVLLMLCDAVCVLAAYFCTLLFRFGGDIPPLYMNEFLKAMLPLALIHLACFWGCHLYSSLWEHASIDELIQTVAANLLGMALSLLCSMIVKWKLPNSVYIAATCILILMVGWLRMCYRVVRRLINIGLKPQNMAQKKVLVVGGGSTGATIIKQMFSSKLMEKVPVAVADDDTAKHGTRIHGVKVVGTTYDIPAIAKKYKIDEIVFCIPSASQKERRRILETCTAARCELKIIPGIEAMLEGIQTGKIRDVDIGDLLEREEVKLDVESICGYIRGSVILVTGGGGSIGSEICRQIAPFAPKKLVIFDIYENNAYELYVDLKRQYRDALDIEVIIGSVRDKRRLDEVFEKYRPDVVFHAAAHKHVPLMEVSAGEAVKNNVFGTLNTAMAADEYGCKRFVLISTDKAVNPTNIMGATKYLCELIIQYMNHISENTQYVAVRFGNVLGSNGSVIPLFRRQIAKGGPVTVTHKDMTRYFMTIPEAAKLVIQAGSMAREGQIFILDMGEPVSIDQFARTFIKLSGFEPDIDIKIEYTGLRPGEKMYEELLQESEGVAPASFSGIMVGKAFMLEPEEIKRRLEWLRGEMAKDDLRAAEYIAKVVPTYHHTGA